MNRFWSSISDPTSFSRQKTISKYPVEFAVHQDVSTDTTAIHFRSSVGGWLSEKWTSLNAKVGRLSPRNYRRRRHFRGPFKSRADRHSKSACE